MTNQFFVASLGDIRFGLRRAANIAAIMQSGQPISLSEMTRCQGSSSIPRSASRQVH